jgi:hypothetical protein
VIFPPSRHAQAHALESTQTERRFDLVELDRFRYDTPAQMTAWINHLTGVEGQLRLLKASPGMLTGGHMPEYLFERTNGVVGLLERLAEDGCQEAIDSGTECLTEALLDGIAIAVDNAPGRDPSAGEIPDVPGSDTTKPRAPRGQRSSPRSNSSDFRNTSSVCSHLVIPLKPHRSTSPI